MRDMERKCARCGKIEMITVPPFEEVYDYKKHVYWCKSCVSEDEVRLNKVEGLLKELAREIKHIDPTAQPTLENPKYAKAQAEAMRRMMEALIG